WRDRHKIEPQSPNHLPLNTTQNIHCPWQPRRWASHHSPRIGPLHRRRPSDSSIMGKIQPTRCRHISPSQNTTNIATSISRPTANNTSTQLPPVAAVIPSQPAKEKLQIDLPSSLIMIPHSIANPLGHDKASFRQVAHDTVTALESFTAAVGGAPPIFSTVDLDTLTTPSFITAASTGSSQSPSFTISSKPASSGHVIPSISSHLPSSSSTTITSSSTDAGAISSQQPLLSPTDTTTAVFTSSQSTQILPPQSLQSPPSLLPLPLPPSTTNEITPGLADQHGSPQNTCLGAAALVGGTVLSGIAFFVMLLYASYALSRWWAGPSARRRGRGRKRLGNDSSVEMCEFGRRRPAGDVACG
ncbi:hypothetical protein B0T19DRAFT_460666, partial [Cercophora scortea]